MKWFKWLLVAAVTLILVVAAYLYWRHHLLYPTTDDAYVQAHVARIASRVTGRVVETPVADNQHVEKDQLLLKIDPAPFKIALEQAQAQLSLAGEQAAAAQAAVRAARARVMQDQARLEEVQLNTDRTLTLVARHELPAAKGDDVRAQLKEARAALAAAQADLQQAMSERGAPGAQNARVRAAEAAVAQARLDLQYTEIRAPAGGRLGEMEIRPGAMVDKNEVLFPLVEDGDYWVNANYKEDDLQRIQPGQHATIQVSLYPDHRFRGVVDSVSPASGVAFSLLPPENATGNWVKVTQRFPVKIEITDPDPAYPLRVGASTGVSVDTRNDGSPTH